MTALRQRRATWTREQHTNSTEHQDNSDYRHDDDGDDLVAWEFDRSGHASVGERTLVISAALRRVQQGRTAREELQHQRRDVPIEVPDGQP